MWHLYLDEGKDWIQPRTVIAIFCDYLLVWEVDEVGVRVLGAGAVEPLVAVLALEAEALPLVDRPDVLLQADLRRQLLPAYVAHDAPAMLGLLVPETHCSAVTTWYE